MSEYVKLVYDNGPNLILLKRSVAIRLHIEILILTCLSTLLLLGDFLADGGVSGVNWKLETECRMRKGDGGTGWTCQDCSYISKVRMLLVSHIESQHLSGFPGYKCALCGAHSTTYYGLEKHTSRQHSISLAKMKNVNSIG